MKLVVVEDGAQSRLELDGPVVSIGRAIDNDIRLSAALASRYHCRLEENEEGVWVVDLGSSNGTQVNGRRVERVLLAAGDVLGIGGAHVHLEAGSVKRAYASQEDAGYATMRGDIATPGGLQVYADITRVLAEEVELEPLLVRIVDSAIALVGGERGFGAKCRGPSNARNRA